MSLRARLVLVVVLAAIALAAAATAITHVLSSSDAARWARAEDSATTIAAAYAEAQGRADAPARAPIVLAHVADAALGRCDRAGSVTVDATSLPAKPHPPGPEPAAPAFPSGPEPPAPALPPDPEPTARALPPDQQERVARLCAGATGATTVRLEHPKDLMAIAVRALDAERRVWAIRRVPRATDPDAQTWHLEAVVLGGATIALVLVAVGALLVLGRGVRTLEAALKRLERDPRAQVELPPAAELARIGVGLRAMASHLADAHAREQALSRDLAQGERLRSLGRVSAGIAHEVRNPLAGIKLQLDVLDRTPDLTASARAGVQTCLHEIARLDRLVGALLQVARHPPRQRAAVDLHELAAQRIALVTHAAAARRIQLEVTGAGTAVGDPDALAQIVENLLRNAVDASPEGGTVTVAVADGQLTVIDRGPGIAAAQVDRLFEPFHTTKPEGTGLGLWMSRALAEAQGGALGYVRRADTTCFELTLADEARP